MDNLNSRFCTELSLIRFLHRLQDRCLKAWLPKASTDNERSLVVIETPDGQEILVRQIAGAMARRIVTYAKAGEECFIDQHMGFIKFGSRVDLYLPLDVDLKIELDQKTVGNETVIATFK